MKEEKQIVLFFNKGTRVDNTQLAAKLSEKFKILGDAIVLPFNEKDITQPLIIFNQGPMSLSVNATDVNIIYNADKHKEFYQLVVDIVSYFEDLDYYFERLGYISTLINTKKDKEKFVNEIFKNDKLASTEFNVSWYEKALIDSVSVNVWQRELTDTMNGIEMISVFDINTPRDESYNITSDFINEFLKKCDKYIENNDLKM